MDTTTQNQGVPSVEPNMASPQDAELVDQFQNLFDAGAFEPTDDYGNDIPGQAPDSSRRIAGQKQAKAAPRQGAQERDPQGEGDAPSAEAQGEPQGEQQGESEAQGEQAEQAEQEGGEGDRQYESLDAYLQEQQIEPESFMQLPVTVKVDGAEQQVPLGEVVKSYQLSSAAYNRMQELASERASFTSETAQVRNALGVRIQQIESLLQGAQQAILGDYQRIDWNRLRTENPGEYAALSTEFQQRQQALQQQLQQVAHAKREEAQQAEAARLQALPQEQAKLLAARPDWRDPAKAQAAHRAMVALGRRLGFTDAELNGVIDHRQLLILDMAARYAQLQASAPQQLKRVRAAPRMGKPGMRQARDPKRVALSHAASAWQRSGFQNDDAAAALLEQLG